MTQSTEYYKECADHLRGLAKPEIVKYRASGEELFRIITACPLCSTQKSIAVTRKYYQVGLIIYRHVESNKHFRCDNASCHHTFSLSPADV